MLRPPSTLVATSEATSQQHNYLPPILLRTTHSAHRPIQQPEISSHTAAPPGGLAQRGVHLHERARVVVVQLQSRDIGGPAVHGASFISQIQQIHRSEQFRDGAAGTPAGGRHGPFEQTQGPSKRFADPGHPPNESDVLLRKMVNR